MTGEALIDAVTETGPDRVFVARTLEPALRREVIDAFDGVELPFVGGRAVIPTDINVRDLVVAGHPNHLGIFDLPACPWLAVAGRWSSLREPIGAIGTVAIDEPATRGDADAALAAADAVAKRARQLRGVALPFHVESPVVVVMLDRDPAPLAAMVDAWSTLSGYPELPGGLRIEVRDGQADRYASALEWAITEEP